MSRSDRQTDNRHFHVAACADWEEVAEATAGLHDAIVREVVLVGDEYLDTDYMLKMTDEVGAIVRMLVHIQRRELPAAELRFVGVREFAHSSSEHTDPARCSESRDGLLLFEVASVAVTARTCDVTLLDAAALGRDVRLVEPMVDDS